MENDGDELSFAKNLLKRVKEERVEVGSENFNSCLGWTWQCRSGVGDE
jgi:hypothetical protein